MATKNQAAAAARAKAQQQVKAKERRTTAVIIAVSLLVIVGFAAIVFFIVNSSKVPPLPEAHAPESAGSQGDILVGATGTAGEDVADDVVQLDLYIDLFCSACGKFEAANAEMLAQKREAGEIAINYHILSFLDRYSVGTKYSTRSASAAAFIADRAPQQYAAFIDAMYVNQPEEKTPGLSNEEIATIAAGVGVPADVVQDLASDEFTPWVLAATQDASMRGVGTTPTVIVDGTELDQSEVLYMQPGVLEEYIESLPK